MRTRAHTNVYHHLNEIFLFPFTFFPASFHTFPLSHFIPLASPLLSFHLSPPITTPTPFSPPLPHTPPLPRPSYPPLPTLLAFSIGREVLEDVLVLRIENSFDYYAEVLNAQYEYVL